MRDRFFKDDFNPSLEFIAKGAFVSIGISAIVVALIVPAIIISGYSISPDHVFFIALEESVKIIAFRILKRDAVGVCLGFGLMEFFLLK
ncbi:MAG: hypothetical protein V2I74_08880, partial [Erythrobacter sp.]|nr:hypothetical protein [Erythrobacter sp.]